VAPRARLVLVAASAILALAGCPLESDQPLSDPSSALVDAALVGAWRMRDSETGEWHRLTLVAFDEHELVAFTPGDAPDSIDALRVFITPVGDQSFMNLKELGSSSSGWYLARYAIDAGHLTLSVVDDSLFIGRSFASPQELHAFVETRLSDPRLYAGPGETPQDMVWERVP
jgi:hypothetical protein